MVCTAPDDGWAVPLECASVWVAAEAYKAGAVLPWSNTPRLNVSLTMKDNLGKVGDGLLNTASGMLFADPRPNAMIGCSWSSISKASAPFMSSLKEVMVGYSSTNAALSNKEVYPYFVRTVPPDSYQGKAVADVLVSLNYTKVTVLYSDDAYSEGLYNDFRSFAQPAGIEMSPFKFGMGLFEEYEEIVEQADAIENRVYVFMVYTQGVGVVWNALKARGMVGPSSPNVFVGSEAVAAALGSEETSVGVLGVRPVSKSSLWPAYLAFRKTLKLADAPAPVKAAFALAGMDQSDLESDADNFYDPFGADAVFAVMLAVEALVAEGHPMADIRSELLLQQLYATSFNGMAGPAQFNEDGDRLLEFEIYNKQRDAGGAVVTKVVGMCSADGAEFSEPPVMFDGTIDYVPGAFEPCLAGSFGAKLGSCTPCLVGTYAPFPGMASCEPCSAGSFASTTGASACAPCAPGSFGDAAGLAACALCGPGSMAPSAGALHCAPCAPGFVAPEEGQEECTLCDAGAFAAEEGSTECQLCPHGSTRLLGATSAAQCQCLDGSLFVPATQKCVPCPDGLRCQGNDEDPLVEPGFFAEWNAAESAPLVYSCAAGEASCPGVAIPKSTLLGAFKPNVDEPLRLMRTCAEGSGLDAERWCARCEDPISLFDGEACVPCSGARGAFYVLFFCAMVGIVLAAYALTATPRTEQLTASIMVLSLGSIALSMVQSLGIYAMCTMEWPPAMEGILALMRLFLFDVDLLHATCVVGPTLTGRWGARVVAPIVFLGLVAALFASSKAAAAALKRPGLALNGDKLLNALGLMTNAVYISLAKMCMQLLECQAHPGAPATLVAYPDYHCDDPERAALLPINGFFILLIPVGVFVLFCWICYAAPSHVTPAFQTRTRFLLRRWRPTRWYFGPVAMARNFLLAVVVVAASDAVESLAMMSVILQVYIIILSIAQPWRANFLNYAELVLMSAIVAICLFSIAILPAPAHTTDRRTTFEPALITAFVFAFSVLGCAVLFAAKSALQLKGGRYTVRAGGRETVASRLSTSSKALSAISQAHMLGLGNSAEEEKATRPDSDSGRERDHTAEV